ncbi:MAG: hypothetical protein QOD76_736 [Solirubrobacteraceae bacterium]|nr:hypothetical protein [Solirubrobacteraceae bacterium]
MTRAQQEAELKVLIADDHPLILAGIRRTLESSDSIQIVGEARNGRELLALVERRSPDLVLMDLRLPDVDGLECLEQIKRSWPDVKAVVLSALDDRDSIDAALRAGASAYIVKSVNPVDISSVLRQASEGTVYHAPSAPVAATEPPAADEPALTERETAILEAVASGLTTKAISQQFWVTEHTVKFHLTNIYRKLDVPNRAGAVRYAFEHCLVGAGN